MSTEKPKPIDHYSKMIERFESSSEWSVSRDLFGDVGAGIYDFEFNNYNYLLDNAEALETLIEGLEQLSPLADDALEIAKTFTTEDFDRFKAELSAERNLSDDFDAESIFPNTWLPLLMPSRFTEALPLAMVAEVPLGVAMIRIIELEKRSE